MKIVSYLSALLTAAFAAQASNTPAPNAQQQTNPAKDQKKEAPKKEEQKKEEQKKEEQKKEEPSLVNTANDPITQSKIEGHRQLGAKPLGQNEKGNNKFQSPGGVSYIISPNLAKEIESGVEKGFLNCNTRQTVHSKACEQQMNGEASTAKPQGGANPALGQAAAPGGANPGTAETSPAPGGGPATTAGPQTQQKK
jgi:hypothetical protein